MKLVNVDPKDIDELGQGTRSSSVIAEFIERNVKMAKLELGNTDKTPSHFRAALGAYVKAHEMDIEVFMKNGDVYLSRLDLTNDNKPIKK